MARQFSKPAGQFPKSIGSEPKLTRIASRSFRIILQSTRRTSLSDRMVSKRAGKLWKLIGIWSESSFPLVKRSYHERP